MAEMSNGFKKEKSVQFTGKLAHIALVLAMINLVVEIYTGKMQAADIAILVAAIITNAIMAALWEKEKKERNLVGSVWRAKSKFDL